MRDEVRPVRDRSGPVRLRLGGWCFRVAVTRVRVLLREDHRVTLGRADRQGDLFDDVVRFCEDSLPENSIYGFLARERDRLFPDELFADLFGKRGRQSVPPSVVDTVMVLQRLDGLGPGGGRPVRPSTCGGATRPGWSASARCWTRPRCMTRWPRWTP